MPELRLICASIIEKDGKYLLVQETKERVKGKFNFPAGKLEVSEDILQGTIREAKEETGFDVVLDKLVGVYQMPSQELGNNVTVFVFKSEIVGGELTTSDEHPVVDFYTYEQFLEFSDQGKLRNTYILSSLNDYRDGRFYDLDILRILK